jgi:hypothetical protein
MAMIQYASFSPSPLVFEYTGSDDDDALVEWVTEVQTVDDEPVVVRQASIRVEGDQTYLDWQDYYQGEPEGDPVNVPIGVGSVIEVGPFVYNPGHSSARFVSTESGIPEGTWRCDEYGRPLNVSDLESS